MNPPNNSSSPTPRPTKTPATKLVVIAILVLVLAAGAVITYLLWNGGDNQTPTEESSSQTEQPAEDAPAPKPTTEDTLTVASITEQYVAATNARDQAAANALTCDKDLPGLMYASVATNNGNTVTITGQPKFIGASDASVVTQVDTPGEGLIDFKLLLAKVDGKWCVSY